MEPESDLYPLPKKEELPNWVKVSACRFHLYLVGVYGLQLVLYTLFGLALILRSAILVPFLAGRDAVLKAKGKEPQRVC